jgi:hypothetical protein
MFQKTLVLFCAVSALSSSLAFAARSGPTSASLGVDLGFLMQPGRLRSFELVPGSYDLDKIITIGARALDWVDVLQKDVPTEQREQIWRRADRLGHEATPDAPTFYNPNTIVERFEKAMANAPEAVVAVLRDGGALPKNPPVGLSIREVVGAIRPIHKAYSDASRWTMLYNYRWVLDKDRLDLRGWIKLARQRESVLELAKNWAQLTEDARTALIANVSQACPYVESHSASNCQSAHKDLVKTPQEGEKVAAWINSLLSGGQAGYDAKFGVQQAHEGAKTQTKSALGVRSIEIPTFGIDSATFDWIQARVHEAWTFTDVVGVTLFPLQENASGAVQVVWQPGTTPHVNGIAGDTITMDSNTPKWLEVTQITMRHEMGHVLGFPDCYTEFWDDDLNGFTYYTLDPNDAMCALSGNYLDRHRDALLKGYF